MFTLGVKHIKPVITSKEAIMSECRKIVAEKGLSALNMRTVASECHIALGTLYNYYSGKEELLLATIESVWRDIFHTSGERSAMPFPEYIEDIFRRIQRGIAGYPDFFTAHSMILVNSGKDKGKTVMDHYFGHIRNVLLFALRSDPGIDRGVFTAVFSEEDLAAFVLDNILMLLVQGKSDCSVLVQMIRRAVCR